MKRRLFLQASAQAGPGIRRALRDYNGPEQATALVGVSSVFVFRSGNFGAGQRFQRPADDL